MVIPVAARQRSIGVIMASTDTGMPVVVFFRGINVGGHVGAAGTFVVRKPGPRADCLPELRRKLPFEAGVALCEGSDLIRLEMENSIWS